MSASPDCPLPVPAAAQSARTRVASRLIDLLFAAPGRTLDRLLVWQERWCQRQDLMGLDERMLRDIGLHRADAYREYRKRPWQI